MDPGGHPGPGGANQSSILFGMGATGPSDVWAVGRYYLSAANTPHTLIALGLAQLARRAASSPATGRRPPAAALG